MNSKGLKRLIATLLGTLIALASTHPATSFLVPILTKIAALIGGVGLLHAAGARTLSANVPVTVGALLQFLIGAASYIHEINPFVPFLQELVALLGTYAVGKVVASKS